MYVGGGEQLHNEREFADDEIACALDPLVYFFLVFGVSVFYGVSSLVELHSLDVKDAARRNHIWKKARPSPL